MRQHNSPQTKTTNIYKSSTMLRKVNPQETILTSNMIQSKKQLNSVRSQQHLRTSQSPRQANVATNEYIKDSFTGKPIKSISTTSNRNIGTLQSKQSLNTLLMQSKPNKIDIQQNYKLNHKNSQMININNLLLTNNSGIIAGGNNKKNNKMEQKAYTYENQDQYIGEWIYDEKDLKQKPHQYGCYKFKRQGLQYRGYFVNGIMQGQGSLYRLSSTQPYSSPSKNKKPQLIYEGQWLNGKKNGTGKYYYDNNIYYEGNWNSNHKQGYGRFVSPEGEFNGLWYKDKKNGKGLLRLNNGIIYDGEWENDFFINGEVKYSNGDFYKGNLNERFQRHGQGEYFVGTRDQVYKGTWRNNKKQGNGQITYANGQKYVGPVRNDIRQGNNCLYEWKNGTKVVCSFQNNFPSKGKLIINDSKKTQIEFDMRN